MKRAALIFSLILIIGQSFADNYKCSTDNLNIRNQPSAQSKVIGALKNTDVIDVISVEGDWAMFIFEGEKAYVSMQYLVSAITPDTTSTSDSLITGFFKKLYSFGWRNWQFYIITIVGLLMAAAGYYAWGIDDLVFGIDDLENDMPKLFAVWGVLFGAFSSIWDDKVFRYLNNFSLIPAGADFAIWVLWILGILIIVMMIAFSIKSYFQIQSMAIFRIGLTLILGLASLFVCAMLIHMLVDWLHQTIGIIILIIVLYIIFFTKSDDRPDFTFKDQFGNVFKGWIHIK